MISHFVATIVVMLLVTGAAVAMKPTKVYLRAMENALDGEKQLMTCRAGAFAEPLKDIECFDAAVAKFAYNASWNKQAGALFVMTAQRRRAYQHFNSSLYIILEANGFVGDNVPNSLSPVSWLKLYHTREKDGSLELAKVWFQKFQMEHETQKAWTIVEEFIAPLEDFSESTDLHRTLGSIADVLKIKREWRLWKEQRRKKRTKVEKESTAAVVSEELARIAEELANRWLSAPLTATNVGREASVEFSRKLCGIGYKYKAAYSASEMLHYLSVCLAKWGELRQWFADEGSPQPYGALLRTPLHSLAAFAPEYSVRLLLELYPDLLKVVDNFGSTPAHYAAAFGNAKALVSLASVGGTAILSQKDAGNLSPLHIACNNAFFRGEVEAALRTGLQITAPCGAIDTIGKIHDEEIEDDDETSKPDGGGWRGATHHPDTSQCDFDVRHALSMSHHELIGRYVHSGQPIVLRNAIPRNISEALRKKDMSQKFGHVSLRKEEYPAAEIYGGRLEGTVLLSDWLDHPSDNFASIEVPSRHPLRNAVDWFPPKLVLGNSDEGYTSKDDSFPRLILASTGATTNQAFRSAHSFFALAHGVQQWFVAPPIHARSTRGKLNTTVSDSTLLKCTIHSGDVIVLPSLWSSAFKSQGESVGFMRRFVWK